MKEIRENRTYLEDLNDLAESYHEVLEISNLNNVSLIYEIIIYLLFKYVF